MKIIDKFSNDFSFLSNFYPCKITLGDIQFPTTEHAYQASKTLDVEKRLIISRVESPGLAKDIGKYTKIRSDWENVKVGVMEQILIQKFNQEEFKKKLLATGDATLIEGNWWHDNFWGSCYCHECKDITGKNMLGKLLMKIRSKLRDENSNKEIQK